MTDLKDILEQEDGLGTEELLRYLQGNATAEERFAIEKQMADSDFVNEAVEGLQHFNNPAQMREYAAQLNKQLQNLTAKKAVRKSKRKIADQNWLIMAILGILLICVIGFLVIHFAIRH